ncbi:hypothetical protein [Melghirimyces algeriensis]|uniref:Uncharacterized protein n=1 Tax=Melghirimyces algeriensis TaxID=910412 RepID=A0A521F7D1_9BACL|nr:hypothetical protein [Melghirimyces algeriensis]SMO91996.1 hypothetical protein SAMN06264849_1149 [Melghirimyces algeriensis]
MNANKKTRQTAKMTGFASGFLFLFGIVSAVDQDIKYALLYLLSALILFGLDVEFKEKEGDD